MRLEEQGETTKCLQGRWLTLRKKEMIAARRPPLLVGCATANGGPNSPTDHRKTAGPNDLRITKKPEIAQIARKGAILFGLEWPCPARQTHPGIEGHAHPDKRGGPSQETHFTGRAQIRRRTASKKLQHFLLTMFLRSSLESSLDGPSSGLY